MDPEQERSGSGAPVFRHAERDPDATPEISGGDPDLIEAVTDHVKRHLGEVQSVFHEIVSPVVHVDVLSVAPSEERPFWTLVSCGMAERAMTSSPDPDLVRAELFVCLPPDWPLEQEAWHDERHYWPVRLLKTLARLPHEYETWLWQEHTVPNDDPPVPYAEDTELCGAILAPPILMPDGFRVLERADEDDIWFFAVLPLHADEMQLKLDRGAEALYDRFEEAAVDIVIDPRRPSTGGGRRRRRFGLF
jgi:hypothetical protein